MQWLEKLLRSREEKYKVLKSGDSQDLESETQFLEITICCNLKLKRKYEC